MRRCNYWGFQSFLHILERKIHSYNMIFNFFLFNGIDSLEASLWCCSDDAILNTRPPCTHNEGPGDETRPPRSLLPSLLK